MNGEWERGVRHVRIPVKAMDKCQRFLARQHALHIVGLAGHVLRLEPPAARANVPTAGPVATCIRRVSTNEGSIFLGASITIPEKRHYHSKQ